MTKRNLLAILALALAAAPARAMTDLMLEMRAARAEKTQPPEAAVVDSGRGVSDENRIYMYKLWDSGAFRACVFQGPCETYDGELERAAKVMEADGVAHETIYSESAAEGAGRPSEKAVTDWVKKNARAYYLISREGWRMLPESAAQDARPELDAHPAEAAATTAGRIYVSPKFYEGMSRD